MYCVNAYRYTNASSASGGIFEYVVVSFCLSLALIGRFELFIHFVLPVTEVNTLIVCLPGMRIILTFVAQIFMSCHF